MGRDGCLLLEPVLARDVSIHAPAWGATDSPLGYLAVLEFQSTRPHGARPILEDLGIDAPKFQSTRPHGARLWRSSSSSNQRRFQSTRPHGARLATPNPTQTAADCFNPRARMGRDPTLSPRSSPSCSFNPRARMGRDSNLFNLQITNPLEDGFRENNAKHHPLPYYS